MRSILAILGIVLLCPTLDALNNSTLQLVHVFFRHGSRTPEVQDLYPNDPYDLDTFQPMGLGQLTNNGKKRAFKLGKVLRRRYDTFLGDIYYPNSILARTTDFDRTKMTALLVLAGLYPPSPVQLWNDDLDWMPIPYHFERGEHDYFIRRPTAYCPNYLKELEKVLVSNEVQRILKENRKILQYISKHTGKSITKLIDVFGLYQTLNAEENMGLTLPKWTESVYPDIIHSLASKQCAFENNNTLLKRLHGGRILKKVIENMILKTNGNLNPPERKMYLFSGHENNVINILAVLGVYEPHVPKYSAAVVIELHHIPDMQTHAVKIFYFASVNAEPEEKQLPGCEEPCTLDEFIRITEPYIPHNYTAECDSKIPLG